MAAAQTKPTVFIDGEAGTTGLGIRDRLREVKEVDVRSIAEAQRKDTAARQKLMAEVDLVILCLPDDAAREAVALADDLGERSPRILDASTAHRVAPDWVFGFPELTPDQPKAIAGSHRVSNPGCYSTGAIALLRPIVDSGFVPKDYPIVIHAVSGYSGGGKTMIEAFETGRSPSFETYGLKLEHKHLPELQAYSGLTRRPIMVPSVGRYRQGMIVCVPLHLDTLPGKVGARDLEAALAKRYAGSEFISVKPAEGDRLEPEALNNTNKMELRVYPNDQHRQVLLVARLDNLGKGASGAALQNLRLMLKLPG
jgi:N-acetyl-gamma-glutamyl-phosphate reductase